MKLFKRKEKVAIKSEEYLEVQRSIESIVVMEAIYPILALDGITVADIDNFKEHIDNILNKGYSGDFLNGYMSHGINGKLVYKDFEPTGGNQSKVSRVITEKAHINKVVRAELSRGVIIELKDGVFVKTTENGVVEIWD